jgi:YjbE family integral membrane protein
VDLAVVWSYLRIIFIDVALAGDNAVVIAMAARTLPKHQRKKAIVFGAAAAIVMRVAITVIVTYLLRIPFLSAIGGAVVLWIAVKLLVDEAEVEGPAHVVKGFWHAIWIIAVADFVMSTDNMLAVAGASEGAWERILFGLGLSIPIIMFCSGIISNLMDRYPVLADIGAGILGWTGGDMIVDDTWVKPWLGAHVAWAKWMVPAFCAVGVIAVGRVLGRLWATRTGEPEEKKAEAPASHP